MDSRMRPNHRNQENQKTATLLAIVETEGSPGGKYTQLVLANALGFWF